MPLNAHEWIPMRLAEYRKLPRGPINCIVVDEPNPELTVAFGADGIAVTTLKDARVALASGCKWPHVRIGGSEGADAGPTGVPWVDANGYLVQLTSALHPDEPLWLDYSPPQNAALSVEAYRLAVCDAAAYGGHWVIRSDAELLPVLSRTAAFFEDRKAWRDYRPIANLAVVFDFAGQQRSFAAEVLNLLSRRLVPYEVIPEARAEAADLTRFAAVLWISNLPPPKQYGGILIRPESGNPFQAAADTHLRMGRRNDLLRLWNDGSMNACYTAAPDDREHLVQLVNYSAANASDAVTLGLARKYKSAFLHTLDDPPKEIAIHPARAGIELRLPAFPVYAAISLRP